MKYAAIIFICLAAAGCTKGMSYAERLKAIKDCEAIGGQPREGVNILFETNIDCWPKVSG